MGSYRYQAAASAAAPAWTALALADATLTDPLSVIDTINTSTGAFTSTATACSFETGAAQPPTWSWDIPVDCETDMAVEVWAEGLSFEVGASNGIAVVLTDSVLTASGAGLMAAMTSTASALRVAAGAFASTLGDVAPGAATWEVLYGRFSLLLVSGADRFCNTLARLLDNSSPRDMVSTSTAVSGSAASPTLTGGTAKLAVAYQQDATIRSGVIPPTIYYRVSPRAT